MGTNDMVTNDMGINEPMYACMYVYTYVCMYVRTYVCMYGCMDVYACMHV